MMRADAPRAGAPGRLGPTKPAVPLGPRQERVLALLDQYPGLNIDELAGALGVQRTAAKHHVQALERRGMLVRVRQGRHLLHFPADLPPVERLVFTVFRVPSVRRVAEEVFLDPSVSREALAERLEVTPRTVRRALGLLLRQGLMQVHQSSGQRTLHLHPQLRVLLARQPSPPQARASAAAGPPVGDTP